MFYWALIFFIIALIAGLFGFTDIAGVAMGIAKILFFVFLGLLGAFWPREQIPHSEIYTNCYLLFQDLHSLEIQPNFTSGLFWPTRC